jgi:hypothetical protein
VPFRDRIRLERSLRYAARPPLSNERLSLLPDGRLRYKLKRRWSDGTAQAIYEPMELMERLAALVPPPRFNITRYFGVLAPGPAAVAAPPGSFSDERGVRPRDGQDRTFPKIGGVSPRCAHPCHECCPRTTRLEAGRLTANLALLSACAIFHRMLPSETRAWNRRVNKDKATIQWKFTRRQARKTLHYTITRSRH